MLSVFRVKGREDAKIEFKYIEMSGFQRLQDVTTCHDVILYHRPCFTCELDVSLCGSDARNPGRIRALVAVSVAINGIEFRKHLFLLPSSHHCRQDLFILPSPSPYFTSLRVLNPYDSRPLFFAYVAGSNSIPRSPFGVTSFAVVKPRPIARRPPLITQSTTIHHSQIKHQTFPYRAEKSLVPG
jgi:hypothetical protein